MHLVARLATSFSPVHCIFSDFFAVSALIGEVGGVSEIGVGLAGCIISQPNFRPGFGEGLVILFLSDIPELEMVTATPRRELSGVPSAYLRYGITLLSAFTREALYHWN